VRRMWIMLLAVALALVVALPAGARKPDKPDKPDTGFKPMACTVDDGFAFDSALVTDAKSSQYVWADASGLFTLVATEAGGFNETRYTVELGDFPRTDVDDVLCVEVTRTGGTLSDLRVRWLGCQDCGLFRATGKDLRNFNNGVVFSAGVSVADWTDFDGEKTVAVMPNTKSEFATMTVKIGIDKPEI
jgi:hypothetical protein